MSGLTGWTTWSGTLQFGISLDQGIQTFLVFGQGPLHFGCDQGSTLEETAANHFVNICTYIYIYSSSMHNVIYYVVSFIPTNSS